MPRALYSYTQNGRKPRKSKKTMEKSNIWHSPDEVPQQQGVNIYLRDDCNDIIRTTYDEVLNPWCYIRDNYCDGVFVAWAYTAAIINL